MKTHATGIQIVAVVVALGVFSFRAQITGVLQGDVVEASTGKGIAGASVRIQAGSGEPKVATTDPQGRFRFEGLDADTYEVTARMPGFISKGEAVTGYPDSQRIRLAPGSAMAPVRFEIERYSAIVGKVTDALGLPVAGATVAAIQRYPSGQRRGPITFDDTGTQYISVKTASTDEFGEYRLAPLAMGNYFVCARMDDVAISGTLRSSGIDAKYRLTFFPNVMKPADTEALRLPDGRDIRADIRLVRQGGVSLSGRILGILPDMRVSVNLMSAASGTAPKSSQVVNGQFRFADLLPGKYLVAASQRPERDLSTDNPPSAARREVEVGTEEIKNSDLTLEPTPDIEGAIQFDSGCEATPVYLQLQGDFLMIQHVGADGRFVLRHLMPGFYKIYARSETASPVFARSAQLGDLDVMADGFRATAQTKGPLKISMRCISR